MDNLLGVLHAHAPAADRADKRQLYGRFIGDWETELITHAPDGARHTGQGQIHFGWILEGRAIQDVRWSFTKITPSSFHWLGEESTNGGGSWRLVVEVLARRTGQ